MKAVMKTAPRPGVEIREVPVPEIGDDELLVRIRAAALCGSDMDVYEYSPSVAALNLDMPFIMGHELYGEVVAAGKNAGDFKPGDMVASDSHMPCGACYLCNNGLRHLCMVRGVLGRRRNGCFAQYLALPSIAAVKMPPDMKPEHGALLEPLGVAVHALQKAQISGKSVLILGLGTIGMMACETARLLGAGRLMVVSSSDEKLELAKNLGADHGINGKTTDVVKEVKALTGGRGADVVIEMSGAISLYNTGLDCLSTGGTMVCVGLYNEPVVIEGYNERVLLREITITGIFGRLMFETWEIVKEFIALNRIDLDRYIGAVLPLEEFDKGAHMAKKTFGRIVFKP